MPTFEFSINIFELSIPELLYQEINGIAVERRISFEEVIREFFHAAFVIANADNTYFCDGDTKRPLVFLGNHAFSRATTSVGKVNIDSIHVREKHGLLQTLFPWLSKRDSADAPRKFQLTMDNSVRNALERIKRQVHTNRIEIIRTIVRLGLVLWAVRVKQQFIYIERGDVTSQIALFDITVDI